MRLKPFLNSILIIFVGMLVTSIFAEYFARNTVVTVGLYLSGLIVFCAERIILRIDELVSNNKIEDKNENSF